MVRRICSFCAFFLFLVSASHVLIAQVFPDREELDVVRLVDGTVLKGLILEDVPDQYLEIQLYGGSTFVLGYEQIDFVEQEANPDYGTTWIRIDLGEWGAAAAETSSGDGDDASDTVAGMRDTGPRPLSAGGHLVSGYSYGIVVGVLALLGYPIDVGAVSGDEWNQKMSELNIDQSATLDDGDTGNSFSSGLGLS